MDITQLINNNCFAGRNGLSPRWLILHGTAGGSSAQEIAQFFKGTEGSSNPVSAHYAIDEQGVIYQCNLESDGPYANGVVTDGHDPWWDANGNPNPNNVTISIEHVKPDSANATALTPAQQDASFALVKDICERNGIPMRPADASGGITGHYSIDPVNRSRCPGQYPWQALFDYLANGGNTMNVPQGWSDDGTTLTAPNGHHVIQGFRGWILTHQWDPANQPLEEVQAANPVEDYYQSPSGTRQLFNYCELAWTQARGVYVVGIGNELKGARAERDKLKAQIVALQAQIATLQSQPGLANLQQINALSAQITIANAKIGTLSQVQ